MISSFPFQLKFQHKECQVCEGERCSQCIDGFDLKLGICEQRVCEDDSKCEDGKFCSVRKGEFNFCEVCSADCRSCSNEKDFCTSCAEGKFLSLEFTCVECGVELEGVQKCDCQGKSILNCQACSGEVCGECIDGFSLNNGVCKLNKSNTGIILDILFGFAGVAVISSSIVAVVIIHRRQNGSKYTGQQEINGMLQEQQGPTKHVLN